MLLLRRWPHLLQRMGEQDRQQIWSLQADKLWTLQGADKRQTKQHNIYLDKVLQGRRLELRSIAGCTPPCKGSCLESKVPLTFCLITSWPLLLLVSNTASLDESIVLMHVKGRTCSADVISNLPVLLWANSIRPAPLCEKIVPCAELALGESTAAQQTRA